MPARKSRPKARKFPRCHTCEKVIRIPDGWSRGAAVRRHYWREHRDVMQPGKRAG